MILPCICRGAGPHWPPPRPPPHHNLIISYPIGPFCSKTYLSEQQDSRAMSSWASRCGNHNNGVPLSDKQSRRFRPLQRRDPWVLSFDKLRTCRLSWGSLQDLARNTCYGSVDSLPVWEIDFAPGNNNIYIQGTLKRTATFHCSWDLLRN